MSTHVTEVERALLALDHHERAAVIHHGLQSLEDENSIGYDQTEVDAAWRSELRQRIDDKAAGSNCLIPMKFLPAFGPTSSPATSEAQ